VKTLRAKYLISKNVKIEVEETIILPVVLYLCEIWSLALKGTKYRVFNNMVLKRKFETERDEMTGEWSRLHNNKLCN
jgi:hypothetical protein